MIYLRAVVFDFDDTLMATRATRFNALVQAAHYFGYSLLPYQIEQNWGLPFKELIASLLPSVNYDTFVAQYRSVMKTVPSRVLPGAARLLNELVKRNILVLVLSSGSHSLVRQDLEEAGLWKFISNLYGFEDTPHHKPDPCVLDPLLDELEGHGVGPSQVAYVGDSVLDFKAASGRNLVFYAVLTGIHGRADFEIMGLSDDKVFDSLEELLHHGILLREVP